MKWTSCPTRYRVPNFFPWAGASRGGQLEGAAESGEPEDENVREGGGVKEVREGEEERELRKVG